MTGAITNLTALERWFKNNNQPFFSVKYSGQGEKIIYRNEVLEDIEAAWEELRHQVESQAEAGRAMLEVLAYTKGKANHPVRTSVDIRQGYPAGAPGLAGIAGIGNMGMGSVAEIVATQVKMAMLERDNEDLRNQLASPMNGLERVVTMIGENPALAGLVQTLTMGFLSRGNPALAQLAAPAMQAVNGPPPPAASEEPEANQIFQTNIYAAAGALGISPVDLAVKINQLVQANPGVAQSILQQ